MTGLSRRKLILGAGLMAGAGLVAVVRPHQRGNAGAQHRIEAAIPDRLGSWHRINLGDFVLPPGNAMGTTQYDALVLRGFANPAGVAIYCVITYGAVQDYALQLHRPEVCYPASGFTIQARNTYPLLFGGRDLGASVMNASRDDRAETVLYWTRVGTDFPRSQWQVRQAILRGLARFSLPDGAMVRLSLQGPPAPGKTALLAEFASALVRGLSPDGRALLIGMRP